MANSNKPSRQLLLLPPDCRFTMQQWLYRKSSHTRRYKRCYMVLHKDMLYSLRKPSLNQGDRPEIIMESLRYSSCVITGAEIRAETNEIGELFRWIVMLKHPKTYAGGNNEVFDKLVHKLPLGTVNFDDPAGVEEIFRELNDNNHVTNHSSSNYNEEQTLWLATSNHKVATDWLNALLCVSRYGSMENFVYQNTLRTKHLSYSLPFYLVPFEFFPISSKKATNPKRRAAFTFMKLNIKELLQIPVLDNETLCCLVEYNSSFYILNLPEMEKEEALEVNRVSSNLTSLEDDGREVYYDEYGLTSYKSKANIKLGDITPNHALTRENTQMKNIGKRTSGLSAILGRSENLNNDFIDDYKSRNRLGATVTPANQSQGYNVLSKLWNLNKVTDKKKTVLEKRSVYYGEDAFIHIPMYQNQAQDVLWLHFVTTSDSYIGSASIDNTDFSINEPCIPKTCVIRNIEDINPLNHKRIDITDYPIQDTALKTWMANDPLPEAGLVVLSVVTPKHYGNFMDPVTPAFHSPKDYRVKVTNASTSGGINMLMSNIKRATVAYKTSYTLRRYVRRVLQFQNMYLSFFWMLYLTLVLGVYPDKLLFFSIIALVYYSIKSHPRFKEYFIQLMLTYPILIALLPRKFTRSFLLLPKAVCMACAKRKAFLLKNSHNTEEEVHYETIASERIRVADNKVKGRLTSRKSECISNTEKLVQIEHAEIPMMTPNQQMNSYVSYTHYPGTDVERCKHRGVVLSYLASLFLSQFAGRGTFANFKKVDSRSTIRAFHAIFYEPPPYPSEVIPFFENLVLTMQYYLMVMLLTFSGGINHVQTLHLLHRNRITKKLMIQSASSGIEGKGKEQQHNRWSGMFPEGQLMASEWYENERKALFGTYSKYHLRIYDRPAVSTEDGRPLDIPEILIHNAKVVLTKETDRHGWSYSKNWSSTWSSEHTPFTFVRRRKWVSNFKDSHVPKEIHVDKAIVHTFSDLDSTAAEKSEPVVSTDGEVVPELRLQSLNTPAEIPFEQAKAADIPASHQVLHNIPGRAGYIEVIPRAPKYSSEQSVLRVSNESSNQYGVIDNGYQTSQAATPSQEPLKYSRSRFNGQSKMMGMFKMGIKGLLTENLRNHAKVANGGTYETQQSGFGFSKWRRYMKRKAETSIKEKIRNMIHDRTPRSELERVDSKIPEEVKIHDVPRVDEVAELPVEEPVDEEEEQWTTDIEDIEEEEEKEEPAGNTRRNLFNSSVAFLLIIPLCLLLDIVKVICNIIWALVQVFFWLLGISQEENEYNITDEHPMKDQLGWERPKIRCNVVLHGRQYCYEIPKWSKRCFMGRAKLRIYKAAKGRRSRLRMFTHRPAYKNLNVMFLYTRNKNVMSINPDPEEYYYETYLTGSDDDDHFSEEQAEDNKVDVETAQDPEESERELTSAESSLDDDDDGEFDISLDAEVLEAEMNTFVAKELGEYVYTDRSRRESVGVEQLEGIQGRRKVLSYIKNIYDRKIRKHQGEANAVDVAEDASKPSSEYEGVESQDDMKTEHKVGVLGMLRKAKDRIAVANYYINLFTVRYEKFINMILWRHDTVTKVLLILLVALAIGNIFVSTYVLLLLYLLMFFKSGYAASMWERNIHQTVKRHLDTSLADLEIYSPFWDLSNRETALLIKAIKGFCQIEVTSTLIRESINSFDLATVITKRIMDEKMCRGWERRNWFFNLFRQSPNLLEV